jgi:hypothetical protein
MVVLYALFGIKRQIHIISLVELIGLGFDVSIAPRPSGAHNIAPVAAPQAAMQEDGRWSHFTFIVARRGNTAFCSWPTCSPHRCKR